MIFKFTIDLVSGFPDQHKSYSKSIRCVTIDDEIKGSKLVKPVVLYLIRHDTGLCKKQEINVKKKQDLICSITGK